MKMQTKDMKNFYQNGIKVKKNCFSPRLNITNDLRLINNTQSILLDGELFKDHN